MFAKYDVDGSGETPRCAGAQKRTNSLCATHNHVKSLRKYSIVGPGTISKKEMRALIVGELQMQLSKSTLKDQVGQAHTRTHSIHVFVRLLTGKSNLGSC